MWKYQLLLLVLKCILFYFNTIFYFWDIAIWNFLFNVNNFITQKSYRVHIYFPENVISVDYEKIQIVFYNHGLFGGYWKVSKSK